MSARNFTRLRLARGLALGLALFPAGLGAQDWMAVHGDKPVPVRLFSGTARDLDLLAIADGELELRPVGESGAARVLVPLADAGRFRLQLLLPADFATARERISEGNYGAAIELMRPTVYPMVRFLEVPPEILPIHELVRDFTTALLVAGNLNEGVALLRRMPLASLEPGFFDLALQAVTRLIENGRTGEAMNLLRGLPLSAATESWFPRLFSLAAQLRSTDRLPEALAVYEKILAVPGTPWALRARLWTAYGNVRLGRVDDARAVLASSPAPDREQREFSLHQLVLARIELASEDKLGALDAAAPGVVYSRIDDDWAAELRWIVGQSYEAAGKPQVAKGIYEEIQIFYPGSPWARVAQERLDVLAPRPAVEVVPEPVDPPDENP